MLHHAKKHYFQSDDVEVYPSGEELIAVHTSNDEVHRLNPTAAAILELCDGRCGTEIAMQVAETYPDVSAERIGEEVQQTLTLLASKGVVRAVAAENEMPSVGAD